MSCRAALVVPLVFPLFAPAAPVPKGAGAAPAVFFPTAVGAEWVYAKGEREKTLVVTDVADRRGAKRVTVQSVTPDGRRPYEVMDVSAAGVVRVECNGKPLDPPLVMLKLPARVGDEWSYAVGFDADKLAGTDRVAGVEKVVVPAGTFEAVRVDSEYTFAGPRKASLWFAPGVGLVKMVNEDGETVLRSFTPPRR